MPSDRSNQMIEEMILLSVAVIKLCQRSDLPKSVIDQVIRSSGSIGANFSEAQNASSKKDFINQIYIAKKEASEAKYWLAVIKMLLGDSAEAEAALNKTQQFTMMLQKIINTSKKSIASR